jgi:hypothetical protein
MLPSAAEELPPLSPDEDLSLDGTSTDELLALAVWWISYINRNPLKICVNDLLLLYRIIGTGTSHEWRLRLRRSGRWLRLGKELVLATNDDWSLERLEAWTGAEAWKRTGAYHQLDEVMYKNNELRQQQPTDALLLPWQLKVLPVNGVKMLHYVLLLVKNNYANRQTHF